MPLKKTLAGVVLFFRLGSAFAQGNECEQTLSQATAEFTSGHFYEIPALLKPCLDRNNFTNEQQVRAYLLLCQAYLIIDDPIAAEDSYLKLLAADPEYVATKEKDAIEVVYLSTKFTSTAIFTPHIRLGANTSFTRTIYDLSTGSNPDKEKVKHVMKPGFQFGGGIDWNITDHISLCANAILSYKSFKTIRSKISNDDILTATEKQYWFDVPVYLKYTDTKGPIRPFGYVGYAANLLLGSKAQIELANSSPTTKSQVLTQGPDRNMDYYRKSLNRSFVIGGGARYKMGKDFVFVDVRYMAGLSNMTRNIYSPDPHGTVNPPGLATRSDLAFTRYVDSYFRLDNVSISFGYIRPLYNPRKIKKIRAKGIFRKLTKAKKDEGQ